MEPKTIYCHGEASEFPVGEFRKKAHNKGERHVPYIHNTSPPHYWTGEECEPRGDNGIHNIPVTLAAPGSTL